MSATATERELRLDHLVHLSAPGTLEATIRALEPHFTIVPGGTHAHGLTSNSLIPLAPSGSYLELITFNADPPPASHEWGRGLAGPIDYALFGGLKDGQKEAVEQVAAERRDASLAYREPVAGGRVRPDGKRLEWEVTLPGKVQGRGGLPFFCGDISDRNWRVPELPFEHPSKTVGIASVTILAVRARIADLRAFLTALLGEPEASSGTGATFSLTNYESEAVGPGPKVHLREPLTDEETKYVADRGNFAQYEWTFWTSGDGGKVGVVTSDALGRFVFQRLP